MEQSVSAVQLLIPPPIPAPDQQPECSRCVRPAAVIMSGHLLCGDCFLHYSARLEERHQ